MTFIRPGEGEESVVADPSGALLPRHGPPRLAALNALEAALAADTASTLADMVGDGWPVEVAVEHYRSWWHRRIDAGVDEGIAECSWAMAAS